MASESGITASEGDMIAMEGGITDHHCLRAA